MITVVDDLVAEVISKEGGYCNHENDLGGPTCWGITEREARSNGYTGSMETLPKEVAHEIYLNKYWFGVGLNLISSVSVPISREMFDTGVNMGPAKAGEFLQISLNAFNRQGKDYPDIGEDGEVGPATIRALELFLAKRGSEGESVILKSLNCLQGARYLDISRKRPQNEDFTYGWINNRISL